QIWQENSRRIAKLLVTEGTIQSIELDPLSEIADADEANDHWPRRIEEGRIQLRDSDKEGKNPMRAARDEAKRQDKQAQQEEDNQQGSEDAEDKD
ncbi:MAG: aminopeptidase, partial [bacterium]